MTSKVVHIVLITLYKNIPFYIDYRTYAMPETESLKCI
jgi:hypothetical protein